MSVVDLAERTAQVGEIELAYETFGDPSDPAMLLIMGVGAQMILWPEGLCERLAEGGQNQAPQQRRGSATPRYVIRFDNRDVGHSSKLAVPPPPPSRVLKGEVTDVPYTLADMASDAVGLLDALGIEAAHIVGASMGGMIAQRVAIDHPERALSLASLMSTTGDRAVGRPTDAGLAALITRPPDDREGYVEAFVAARRVVGSPPVDEAAVRLLASRCFDRGYFPEGTARQMAAILASPDRTPELIRLELPTVAVHGSTDPLITLSGGQATAAAIPGAELVVIEGMGHDFPVWAWEKVAKAIEENAKRTEEGDA